MEPLRLDLSVDQSNLLPDQPNACHVVAEIEAGELDAGRERPPLTLVFALDCSASMKGPPLEGVVRSVERIVGLLSPSDRVGIVTFSNRADLTMPIEPATDEAKHRARSLAANLAAGAQTNMEAGLRLAATELLEDPGDDRRRALFLLSDGVPNVGLATPLTLSEVVTPWRGRLSVWSLGYGPHHQEDILSAVSSGAGGRYQYIPEPEICEFMFAKALGAHGAIVAEAVELRLRPQEGARVLRFLGKDPVRSEERVHVVSLPDFLPKTRRLVVAELEVWPASERGLFNLISGQLSYRIPGEVGRSVHDEQFAPVMIASVSSQIVPPARVGVLLARCDHVRDVARSLADRGMYAEAVGRLREVQRELLDWPGHTGEGGTPLAEAAEILQDELMALEGEPGLEEYRAFRRSQLGVSLTGESFNASWQSVGNAYGDSVVQVVAGEYPDARLVQVEGEEEGRVVRLRAEQTLGRSREADVILASDRVSRTHAVVLAQRGRFYVLDLGSANGTRVNGRRVQTSALMDGDVITLSSDAAFQYEERPGELRLVAFPPGGEPHLVEPDRLFVIGRNPACSLVLADDEVANRHAAIHQEAGHYLLEVYAGASAVVRDGKRVRRSEIVDGDRFQFGRSVVQFQLR